MLVWRNVDAYGFEKTSKEPEVQNLITVKLFRQYLRDKTKLKGYP